MRLIDADALTDELTQRCCKNCVKRMGTKNGKRKMIYEIGDAPCKACEVDDMKVELDEAPTINAVEVVRCKDCKYRLYLEATDIYPAEYQCCMDRVFFPSRKANDPDWFCADGERRTDENDN